MWCPEGYYSWHDAFSDVQDLAEEITALVCMGGTPEEDKNASSATSQSAKFRLLRTGLVRSEREADLAIALFQAWLMAHFLEEFPPVAVGLSGNSIMLHPVLLGHREQFEITMFRWPMTDAPEYSQLVKLSKNDGFGRQQLFDRFNFIEVSTGLIRAKNGAREHLVHYEDFDETATASILELAIGLKNFVLCWPEKPSNEEWRRFLTLVEIDDRFAKAADHIFGRQSLDVNAEYQTEASRIRKGGRPSQHSEILACFHQAFPNGVGDHTNSAIARRLGYDRKTVSAALRNAGLLPRKLSLGINPEQN